MHQGKATEKRLFTIKELSTYWGIPVGTLYNWVSEGKLQVVKIGRSLRFEMKFADEFIENHKRQPLNPVK